MPRRILDRLAPAAVLVALAAGLGGCGDDDSSSADPADTTTATDEPTTEPTNEPDDEETHQETATNDASDVAQLEIEIEIEEGEVTPTAEQVEASVGDTVLIEVDSDAADELHVHTAPEEQEFAIKARDDQEFKLKVVQPGQFDVELHESGTLVAQLVVRP